MGKIFLDTNVLVAASVRQHPHYARADDLMQRCMTGSEDGWIHSHSILEYHSAMTQLPKGLAVPPEQVSTLLQEGILPYVTLSGFLPDDIPGIQKQMGEAGLIGGIIYDFFHLMAAQREQVEYFYTFNTAHFKAIADPGFRDRIVAP